MMKMYRSLIYRQIRLTRKNIILYVILFLLFEAVLIMPIVLWNKTPTTLEEQAQFPAYCVLISMLASAVGSFMAGLNNGVHKSDINSGWKRYSYVLPPSPKQKALSGLLVKLIGIVLFLAISLIYALLILIFGSEVIFINMLGSYFLIASVAVLFDTVYCGIIMLAKEKKELKKYSIIASAAGLILFAMLPDISLDDNDFYKAASKISDITGTFKFTFAAILVFALMCTVYFFVMKITYERREP